MHGVLTKSASTPHRRRQIILDAAVQLYLRTGLVIHA
jgi:hypothetical protein